METETLPGALQKSSANAAIGGVAANVDEVVDQASVEDALKAAMKAVEGAVHQDNDPLKNVASMEEPLSSYDSGYADGRESGYAEGRRMGYEAGFLAGVAQGTVDAHSVIYRSAYDAGKAAGIAEGRTRFMQSLYTSLKKRKATHNTT